MSQRDSAKDFLGRGWKFPVRVDEATGRIKTSDYEEDIAEAIRIIIMTRKGERVMQPEFGCDLHEYVFSGTDYTTITQMENEIKSALINWEPRIIDVNVSVDIDGNNLSSLLINVDYVVRSTNNPYNLVYPYYISEGI